MENFYGKEEEDLIQWYNDFNYAAKVNNWRNDKRKLKIITNYLKESARNWFEDIYKEIIV